MGLHYDPLHFTLIVCNIEKLKNLTQSWLHSATTQSVDRDSQSQHISVTINCSHNVVPSLIQLPYHSCQPPFDLINWILVNFFNAPQLSIVWRPSLRATSTRWLCIAFSMSVRWRARALLNFSELNVSWQRHKTCANEWPKASQLHNDRDLIFLRSRFNFLGHTKIHFLDMTWKTKNSQIHIFSVCKYYVIQSNFFSGLFFFAKTKIVSQTKKFFDRHSVGVRAVHLRWFKALQILSRNYFCFFTATVAAPVYIVDAHWRGGSTKRSCKICRV